MSRFSKSVSCPRGSVGLVGLFSLMSCVLVVLLLWAFGFLMGISCNRFLIFEDDIAVSDATETIGWFSTQLKTVTDTCVLS